MLPNETLKLKIAQKIFSAEHPRSDWFLYPNYGQEIIQSRYLQLAGSIIWLCHEEKDHLVTEGGK